MKNFHYRRGSVLMEAVMVAPIFILIFMFIVDFTQISRDQLQVATLGLSAVRIAAYRTEAQREDLTKAKLQDCLDKDHRTSTQKLVLEASDVVRKGYKTRGINGSPWSILVGAQIKYPKPADTSVWFDFGSAYLTDDKRGDTKTNGARIPRTKTYSLMRSAASYTTTDPRHAKAADHIKPGSSIEAGDYLKTLLTSSYMQLPTGGSTTEAGEWKLSNSTAVTDTEVGTLGASAADYHSKRNAGGQLFKLANSQN